MPATKIYLADLSYIHEEGGNWTIIPVPLNIAYLATYALKQFGASIEVKLFKHPETLARALREAPPAILGVSNYIWNKNLSLAVARYAKRVAPATVTVMGGPNYNFDDQEWLRSYFSAHPEIDFHIEGEGEAKLANLIGCLLQNDFDPRRTKAVRPAGVAYLSADGDVRRHKFGEPGVWVLEGLEVDPRGERIRELDDIPSPYLTGVLDDYLRDPEFCPIIETNRGCPYSCTFCVWGDMAKSKSSKFSLERVEAELQYIANKNVSVTPYLYLGDANFGIFERDIQIAKTIKGLKDATGFPQNVYLYFAKNSSEKVLRIASILKDMTPMSLSRQTQNPEVLKNIKRSNISVDTYNSLAALAKELGVETYVELIFGLPGESKQSFYNGVREIMKQEVGSIHFFPAMLLDGSEMASRESREAFGIKGALRRIDGCTGKFGPIQATEYEEIIVESSCFSLDDYFELRLFHFFQNLFLDTKIFGDVEAVLNGTSFFDFILGLVQGYRTAPVAFIGFVDQFLQQSKDEFVADAKIGNVDLEESVPATNPEAVRKLNPYFTVKLLFSREILAAFLVYMKERLLTQSNGIEKDIDEVLGFIVARIYHFGGDPSRSKTVLMNKHLVTRVPALASLGESASTADTVSISMTKEDTYDEIITSLLRRHPLVDAVYELALHHAHETFPAVLTYRIDANRAM